jgi:hypothetical protein
VKLHTSMLIGLTVLAACTAAPPTKPAVTASADIAAVAPIAERHAPQSARSRDLVAELHDYARAHGYKSVTRNNQQAWCRQEPTLGSHFETIYCLTDVVLADQKRLIERNQQEMIHDYRPNCVHSASACN